MEEAKEEECGGLMGETPAREKVAAEALAEGRPAGVGKILAPWMDECDNSKQNCYKNEAGDMTPDRRGYKTQYIFTAAAPSV